MKTAVILLFSLIFSQNLLAGEFKCEPLSKECKDYLVVKTGEDGKDSEKAKKEYNAEMEVCNEYIFSDADYDVRRCNYCQVVSDLENHGTEDEIPNLGYFNAFRSEFEVNEDTTNCTQPGE